MADNLHPDIEQFRQLLAEFNKIPKPAPANTTYLEMARYPRSRFEEVCSRILAFYLQPGDEHGLGTLVLTSLLEVLKEKDYRPESIKQIDLSRQQIKVRTEEYAEAKRIDLFIEGDDFVLAIENKITAGIYNPFDEYTKRVHASGKRHQFLVVLSLFPTSINPVDRHGFIAVTYADLFTRIKSNLGFRYQTANYQHLTFLFDFIQTLENMSQNTPIDANLNSFFFAHEKASEEFVRRFNEHKQAVRAAQIEKIKPLKDLISGRTKATWWLYQDWDLGFDGFGLSRSKGIGIESNFESNETNPNGKFRIYLTTWNLRDWDPYNDFLKNKFPGCKIDKTPGNRVYLHLTPIDGEKEDEILNKLDECYHLLRDYTEELKRGK